MTTTETITAKPSATDILKRMAVNVNGATNTTTHSATATGPAPSPYNPPIAPRDIVGLRDDLIEKANATYRIDYAVECASNGEMGTAQLISDVLSGEVAYDHSVDAYFWWNNIHYVRNDGDIMLQIASDVAVATYKRASLDKHAALMNLITSLAGKEPDAATAQQMDILKKQRDTLSGRISAMQKFAGIDRVLRLARTEYHLGIGGDVWDKNVNLLGVANGVIDLATGKPVLPDPAQYIRTVAPVPYVAGAVAPMWEKAISEIFDGDADKVRYLQRLLGYALSGTCRESDFYVWFGRHGRNGKEFILGRIGNAVGDTLAGVIDRELFLKSKAVRGAGGSNESMMALRGRRIAWATETNDGRQFDLAAMKDLSGGHQMEAIPKYGKQQRWKRTHTPIMLTNHLPRVLSQGLAEWDRIKVLSFPLSFVNEPDPTKPHERKKDAVLGERIDATELPGVLNWLIAGNLTWRANGLQTPACVKADTQRYKQDEDTIGLFIAERCLIDAKAECKPLDLYNAYKFWVDEAEYGKPMGKKRFYAVIEGEKGFKRGLYEGNERFEGIGLLAQ